MAARLDAPDLEQEIMFRNLPDIIVDLLRDFVLSHIIGTHHPWKRHTPEDLERLRARAATPPHFCPLPQPETATALP